MEHTGRQDVEDVLAPAVVDGVAGIVPALEADHHVRPAGKLVDNFTLALVAPLRPDNHNACHRLPSFPEC